MKLLTIDIERSEPGTWYITVHTPTAYKMIMPVYSDKYTDIRNSVSNAVGEAFLGLRDQMKEMTAHD